EDRHHPRPRVRFSLRHRAHARRPRRPPRRRLHPHAPALDPPVPTHPAPAREGAHHAVPSKI
ncbi:MAG: hypothetical protein AVDCRST_MAG89-200, partial [uncultured Gemmatimonadetes bacterium]